MQELTTDQLAGAGSAKFGPWGQRLMAISKLASVIGSFVFVALVLMSIVSITGRKIFSAPVPGDVEILQICSAFAASTFFAYCHLIGGDVKVDFFTAHAKPSTVHFLDMLGSTLVGLFGVLITWRTAEGVMMVKEAGETSMILDLPLWAGQMLMLPGFVMLAMAGFYMAFWHARQMGLERSE